MISINLKRGSILFLSLLLVVSLLNVNVFAQNSNQQNSQAINQIETRKILELGVLDTSTGEIIGTKLLIESPEIWDDSILEDLDEKYILVKNELRDLYPFEQLPLIVVGQDGMIRPFAVETIFDIGNFALSVAEFAISPNFWTGFNVVADGLAVVFPGVPSVTGVKRMINASDTLKESLKVGVKKYSDLQNDTIPADWQRHHIFEKRFASKLGTGVTDRNMLAIPLPKKTHHQLITNKMREKIPYNTNLNTLTKDDIIEAHIDSYKELWDDTGDEVWEFLYEFSQTGQVKALD